MSARERLVALGLELPAPPSPAAAYLPFRVAGDVVHTAGQLPMVDGALVRTGRLGEEIDTEVGVELARAAGLNVLAVLASAAGDLDAIELTKITVYVASAPGFAEQHLVANGASELLANVLGDRGLHARSAVGVAALPLASPVEIDAIARIVG